MSYEPQSTADDAWEQFTDEVGSPDDADNRPDMDYPQDRWYEIVNEHVDADFDGVDCDELMAHTSNPDAVMDHVGEITGKTWTDVQREFCYWAFYADVQDAGPNEDPESYVERVQEEWDEEHGEEEEEESEPPPPPPPTPQQQAVTRTKRMARFFNPIPKLPPGMDPTHIFRGQRDDDDDSGSLMRLPSWRRGRR